MKKQKLIDAMALADDKYVWEARPEKSRNHKMRRLSLIAACLAVFVTAASLWLFVPFNTDPPDVSGYADSEYYDVIRQLNMLTYRKPSDKNNFEKYFGGMVKAMDDATNGGGMEVEAPNAAERLGDNEYVEVTDNQVAGVIEGDLFKRSKTHLYYLYGDVLYIYSIAGEQSECVGEFVFTSAVENEYTYHTYAEMYLAQDGKTVTVIANGYNEANKDKGSLIDVISVISLDVSDPQNVSVKTCVSLTGSYTSSRMVDGKLLLMSEFYVGEEPDFSNPATFLPQMDEGEGMVSIAAENIVLPENLTSTRYTVVSKFDEATLSSEGFCAFLSYSKEVYVSQTGVYATRQYTAEAQTEEGYTDRRTMTEISRLGYANGVLTPLGSFIVDGYIKDQYSMDEYDGIFRVVATTNRVVHREGSDGFGGAWSEVETEQSFSSASLYCIDLATGEMIASVENFAPRGETVESVRFDGTAAYVCTAVVVTVTDPVFFFDLSDLTNITYTDTGVIEGYSTSLINLGEGFLLGIGVGEMWESVKVEVYEEDPTAGNGVASVDAWVMEPASYSTEYKSYYIDRENNLVGLPIATNGGTQYVLLYFDNYKLRPVAQFKINDTYLDYVRATIIDSDLYVLSGNSLTVRTVDKNAAVSELDPADVLNVALEACGVKHDYTTQNLLHNDGVWVVEFWENGAELPAATVTLDMFGNVMSIQYAE
ncbi:MAG: beta-propeller domain-containing protein [Clostridia bacterium]|nr:beta-propeller domain-containing protein [Clostridia bacterium]